MPDFGAWTSTDWSALASWGTLGIAALATGVAYHQVRESRKLRSEQAQPYVVAYMDPSPATPQIIEFVVRNFGATSATNVTLACNPPLRRSTQDQSPFEDVWLFDVLPVLVPGQEWRTIWDFSPDRAKSGLPDRYRVSVAYNDSRGKSMPCLEFVLDWKAYGGRRWVTTYGTHHVAKSLREIEKLVGKWTEDIRGGLAVYVRDGEAKDERKRREYEEFVKRADEQHGE